MLGVLLLIAAAVAFSAACAADDPRQRRSLRRDRSSVGRVTRFLSALGVFLLVVGVLQLRG